MRFEDSWARRLVDASDRLANVTCLRGAMPDPGQVLRWVDAMFGRFSQTEIPKVRAWVDGGQRYTITDELVRLAAQPELALPRRLALAAGAEEYCVTFNGLTAWSPVFQAAMQRGMLEPLFQALGGAPRAGCDFYSFFGNYGFTPFGVHDDADQSLLWHLGPGPKTAYVWPRAAYQVLTGGTLATQDYRALLPHARRFELAPGDLLFIPLGDFHILDTREFSATLGLTLFPDDPALECAEGLRILGPDTATLRTIGSQALTLDELCRLRQLALESNGHVIASPNLGALAGAPLTRDAVAAGAISGVPHCPVRALEVAGREALLVRRRAVWARRNGFFQRLSDAINGAVRLPFGQLAAQFAGAVQCNALLELVCKLHQMGGLLVEGG